MPRALAAIFQVGQIALVLFIFSCGRSENGPLISMDSQAAVNDGGSDQGLKDVSPILSDSYPLEMKVDGLKAKDWGSVDISFADHDFGSLADLVVVSFTAKVAMDRVDYGIKVCNQGKTATAGFSLDLYYDSKTLPLASVPGDQASQEPGLSPAQCHTLVYSRTNTPAGEYQSWLVINRDAKIIEDSTTNNVGGPLTIKVIKAAQADLILKDFTVTQNGQTLTYEANVCNQGDASALLFRVDIYFNRVIPPSPLQFGDVNDFILLLAPNACQTVKKSETNAAVGVHTAWAFADTLGTVAEAQEDNNTSGPKVTFIQSTLECTGFCTFATGCKLVGVLQFGNCLTWCGGFNKAQSSCTQAAAQSLSCDQLNQCVLPSMPPPTPPPWSCIELCNFLQNTCNMVPNKQYLGCLGTCTTLPTTKIQCGIAAMKKNDCLGTVLCVL